MPEVWARADHHCRSGRSGYSCLVTGISLLRHASWARMLAIITAFLALIHPISGTILGIYTLWVLLPAASGQEYEQLVVA
jgi:hypothetical protein